MANQEVGNLAVRISLDQSGFQEGLGQINTRLKVVQSSFKAASAELGGFGKSTEQLKLKSDSLNQQIQLQQEKVEALTSAYERSVETKGADARASQNLQIKLNLARDALATMETELRKTNEQLRVQASGWTNLGESLQTISERLKGVGEKLTGVGEKLSQTITAPVLGAGAAAVKFAGDFEESANKVATIADTQAMSMEDLKRGVLDLSNTVNVGATELNEALYQVISATGDTANALDYVEVASKAAIGGFTDTTTAIDGLTTVMNAYGLKGKDAIQSLSDQMLVAQNYGKTTFAEIAAGIGNVIPIAASLNVKTQDLFASIAVLTKNGIATSESITGLKAALSNVLKPSSDAVDVSAKLGLEFNAAHLKSVGWANFLTEIKDKTKGNTEVMAKLFGSVEALNAVTVLASTGSQDFTGALQAMSQTGGATEKAFETMNQGINDGIDGMLNSLKNLAISIGQILAPPVNQLIGELQGLISWFSGLSDAQKETLIKFAGIAAAVGPVLLVVGKLITAISSIAGAFSAASGAIASAGGLMAVITGPIGIVTAAVVALAAAAFLVIKNWGSIKTFFQGLWKGIEEATSATWSGLTQFLTGIWYGVYNAAASAWQGLGTFFSTLWQGITSTTVAVWTGIQTFFVNLWRSIVQGVMVILAPFAKGLNLIWLSIKDGVFTMIEGIKNYFSGWGNLLKNLVLGPILLILDLITGNFSLLKDDAIHILSNLQAALAQIWQGIQQVMTGTVQAMPAFCL